jgi:beta-glucosidase
LPSIWDKFSKTPGKVKDGTNGDVACDSYHRTHEDIEVLKKYRAKIYRFSLSWYVFSPFSIMLSLLKNKKNKKLTIHDNGCFLRPRIIPLGGRNDPVNENGLQFYSKFLDDLHEAGIEPVVTLFHWDLPDNLVQRYGGFLNKKEFVADYVRYVRVCFEALGSKVKHWITFNEPWCSSVLGYGTGKHAPGRTSDRAKNVVGDSSTEPWIVGHSLLNAHARAVDIYRREYKGQFGGEIGITLNGEWGSLSSPSTHRK